MDTKITAELALELTNGETGEVVSRVYATAKGFAPTDCYQIDRWAGHLISQATGAMRDNALAAEGLSKTSVVPLPIYNDTTEDDDDGRTDTD